MSPVPDLSISDTSSADSAPYKYFVFVSYSRKDSRAARWLQRRLEWFRFPVKLVEKERQPPHGRYLRPVYRDKTNLEVDHEHYWENIKRALEEARFLVVLCSPDAAVSGPVDLEVRHFLGSREDAVAAVVPVILRGHVSSGDAEECLCPALKELGGLIRDRNLPTMVPDAGDREAQGWENGFIGLVAYLLNLQRAALVDHVRREERKKALVARTVAAGMAVLAIAAGVAGWMAYRNGVEARAQRDEVTRQRDKQDELLLTASRGDHEAAIRSFNLNRPRESLAYLARALTLYPRNATALSAAGESSLGPSAKGFGVHGAAIFPTAVTALAFSPNGQWMAGGSSDGSVRVMEPHATQQIAGFTCDEAITGLAFSPGGEFLAVNARDLHVFDVKTGREVSQFSRPRLSIRSFAFSPDGRWIAVGGFGVRQDSSEPIRTPSLMCVFETATGKEISQTVCEDAVFSVAFSPDGRWVACGGQDSTLRVVEAETGKGISEVKMSDYVNAAAFSPNGTSVAVATDKILGVFDAATGKQTFEVKGQYHSIAFNLDGRQLAAAGSDVRVVESATGAPVWTAHLDDRDGNELSFSPDGRLLVASASAEVRIWDAASGELMSAAEFGDSVNAVSCSPDGRWIAAGSEDHTLRVIEASREDVLRLEGSLLCGPADHWLVTNGDDQHVFKAGGEKYLCTLDHETALSDVIFSPDARWIAGKDSNNAIHVFATASGGEVCRVGFDDFVFAMEFSPDARWLAAASNDKALRMVEAATGKTAWELHEHEATDLLAFSPDGRHLAAASRQDVLRVLEAASGKEIWNAPIHGLLDAEFSPDGQWLIAQGFHGAQHVLAATTGRVVFPTEPEEDLTEFKLSPDGSKMAVAWRNSGLHLIERPSGREVWHADLHDKIVSVEFDSGGRFLVVHFEEAPPKAMDLATGAPLFVEFMTHAWTVKLSPHGRWMVGEFGNGICILETVSETEIAPVNAGKDVKLRRFTADGRWLEVGEPSEDQAGGVVEVAWLLSRDTHALPGFVDLLCLQAGQMFEPSGRLRVLLPEEWKRLNDQIYTPTASAPPVGAEGQQAVLRWFSVSPERRNLSPWIDVPLWQAAGDVFQSADLENESTLFSWAGRAPWHPLEPLSLARMEQAPAAPSADENPAPASARKAALTKLTLKRLREADENLYGRDVLAEYAAWAAEIMHEELKLDAEAREAIEFALERTPKEKQGPLLDLRAKLEGPNKSIR